MGIFIDQSNHLFDNDKGLMLRCDHCASADKWCTLRCPKVELVTRVGSSGDPIPVIRILCGCQPVEYVRAFEQKKPAKAKPEEGESPKDFVDRAIKELEGRSKRAEKAAEKRDAIKELQDELIRQKEAERSWEKGPGLTRIMSGPDASPVTAAQGPMEAAKICRADFGFHGALGVRIDTSPLNCVKVDGVENDLVNRQEFTRPPVSQEQEEPEIVYEKCTLDKAILLAKIDEINADLNQIFKRTCTTDTIAQVLTAHAKACIDELRDFVLGKKVDDGEG